VDGQPTPIYRANISVRAVRITQGRHRIEFRYELPGLVRGAWISIVSGTALLLWVGAAAVANRRRT